MIITNCCDMIMTNSCDMIMTNGILLPSKVGWLARFKDIKVSGSYLAGDQGANIWIPRNRRQPSDTCCMSATSIYFHSLLFYVFLCLDYFCGLRWRGKTEIRVVGP